jgi:hypothetical protein
VRIYRLRSVLAGRRRRDLLAAYLGNKSMDKKRVKKKGGARDDSPVKIPPSWQLTQQQRDFINDLWQDDAPEPVPKPATRPDANE